MTPEIYRRPSDGTYWVDIDGKGNPWMLRGPFSKLTADQFSAHLLGEGTEHISTSVQAIQAETSIEDLSRIANILRALQHAAEYRMLLLRASARAEYEAAR